MSGPDPPPPLATGTKGIVEYAQRTNGKFEAQEWFEDQDVKVRSSFGVLFERMVSLGRISNKEHFRQLRHQVWEFKRGGDRLLCYRSGRRWLLTHHIKKGGSRKCPRKEINRAENIGNEHIERQAKESSKKKKNDLE